MHQEVAAFGGTDQAADRGLPFLEILLGLWKLLDIFGSFFEGDERAAAGQGNGIIEAAEPGYSGQFVGAQP